MFGCLSRTNQADTLIEGSHHWIKSSNLDIKNVARVVFMLDRKKLGTGVHQQEAESEQNISQRKMVIL